MILTEKQRHEKRRESCKTFRGDGIVHPLFFLKGMVFIKNLNPQNTPPQHLEKSTKTWYNKDIKAHQK